MSADADTRSLRAVHHDRRIPADDGADAALERFIARKIWLAVGRDCVDVIGGAQCADTQLILLGMLQEREHDVTGACRTGALEQRVE